MSVGLISDGTPLIIFAPILRKRRHHQKCSFAYLLKVVFKTQSLFEQACNAQRMESNTFLQHTRKCYRLFFFHRQSQLYFGHRSRISARPGITAVRRQHTSPPGLSFLPMPCLSYDWRDMIYLCQYFLPPPEAVAPACLPGSALHVCIRLAYFWQLFFIKKIISAQAME